MERDHKLMNLNIEDKRILKFIRNNADRFLNSKLSQILIKFLIEVNDIKLKFGRVDSEANYREKNKNSNLKQEVFRNLTQLFVLIGKIENIFDEPFLIKIKKMFRETLSLQISKSELFKRGYQKPKGYPGDFRMLEFIYNNCPISKKIGFFLDQYFLQEDYIKVIRDRKDWMKDKLRNLIKKSEKQLKILNLACGPCREIRELLFDNSIPCDKSIDFVLVDQDSETLKFAKEKISKIVIPKMKLSFIKADVISFFKSESFNRYKVVKFDLIYSIGLADYLPDSILGSLMRYSFNSLCVGGCLIIAHKNIKIYPALVADWMCDWKFLPRSVNDLKQLIMKSLEKEKSRVKVKLEMKKNERVFFFTITKEK